MNSPTQSTRIVRSAVLVDFDNMFLDLERHDKNASERFATEPSLWMNWLRQLTLEDPDYDNFHRRFVASRCYLNPKTFGRFRTFFVRAGFETVDCPPLTKGGKTSADIHIVIDMLDMLAQDTRVDEFILLSTDADFTPILRRLQRHDRRSVVLAMGNAASAYTAACDKLVDQTDFMDLLIGPSSPDSVDSVKPSAGSTPTDGATCPPSSPPPATPSLAPQKVIKHVRQLIDKSSQAVPASWVADQLVRHFGEEATQHWSATNMRFRDFIENFRNDGGELGFETWWKKPGYLYDPSRHEIPKLKQPLSDTAWTEADGELGPLARRISQVTHVPCLPPQQYRIVFRELVEELLDNGYHLIGTSKGLRDRTLETDYPISRRDANFILIGIERNRSIRPEQEDAARLAQTLRDHIANMYENAGAELDENDNQLLTQWIVGDIK